MIVHAYMRAITMIPVDWQGMTCPRALFSIRDNSLTCVYRDNFSRAEYRLSNSYVCMHIRSRVVTMLLNSQGLVSACKCVRAASTIRGRESSNDGRNSSKVTGKRRTSLEGTSGGKIRFRRIFKNAVAQEKTFANFPHWESSLGDYLKIPRSRENYEIFSRKQFRHDETSCSNFVISRIADGGLNAGNRTLRNLLIEIPSKHSRGIVYLLYVIFITYLYVADRVIIINYCSFRYLRIKRRRNTFSHSDVLNTGYLRIYPNYANL